MAKWHRSTAHYSPEKAQPTHFGDFPHETYKINKTNCVDQPTRIPRLTVIGLDKKLFSIAFDYRIYRVIKKSFRYVGTVTNELNKMASKTAIQMKGRTFSSKRLVSGIAFLQYLKVACNAYSIHEDASMWLFNHYLTSLVESVINVGRSSWSKRRSRKKGA